MVLKSVVLGSEAAASPRGLTRNAKFGAPSQTY